MDFNKLLGITFPEASATFVRAELPITDAIRQPYGFVHGGATLTLLEAAASLGAEFHTDLSRELPFGVNVNVTHRKSGVDELASSPAARRHRSEGAFSSHKKGLAKRSRYGNISFAVANSTSGCGSAW